jgi:enoyl-CoA hydratase
LTGIDFAAHTGTKLRVRAQVLAAVRSGIDAEFDG